MLNVNIVTLLNVLKCTFNNSANITACISTSQKKMTGAADVVFPYTGD